MSHVTGHMLNAIWPSAILHLDGDAFFASCEQAIHPQWRRKPLITGAERGIAASMSYEAKRAGVTRGMRLFEVRKVCPECIIVPSDYETYSIISKRMFEIMRNYSPSVEEYSIDEGFVDLTGLRRPLHGSYTTIAEKIKRDVELELGISVSVGVSLSKTLAKCASEFRKPSGLTVVSGQHVDILLKHVEIESVWGVGPATSALLKKYGVKSAYDFVHMSEGLIKKLLSKPGLQTWQELQGTSVLPVTTAPHEEYKSISKFKTFTPPSRNRDYIFAQLTRNVEKACIKLRRYNLAAERVTCVLRRQDFSHIGFELRLSRASAYPTEIIPLVRTSFANLYSGRDPIRQTGVIVHHLSSIAQSQYSLFDDIVRAEKIRKAFFTVDAMAEKYGKHILYTGGSLLLAGQLQHEGDRGALPQRAVEKVMGERGRQRLRLPRFFAQV